MQLMGNIKKARKAIATLTLMSAVSAFLAVPTFAANPDLDTATGLLTTGGGDMKLGFMTMIAVIIPIIIVVFGIGWLLGLFKRKMNKA